MIKLRLRRNEKGSYSLSCRHSGTSLSDFNSPRAALERGKSLRRSNRGETVVTGPGNTEFELHGEHKIITRRRRIFF